MVAATEMIRRSGQQGVPVIATDDEVIVGFDQVRLGRLAEKFGGPRRPPLGVLGADARDYLSRHADLSDRFPLETTGVFVGQLRPNSVAERAGLRAGDVIVGLAGKRVRTMVELDRLIGTVSAGKSVPVRFLRDGEEQTGTLQF
jgi:S1-C subfamily serine protease